MVDAHESPYKKINFQTAFESSSNVGIAKSVQKYFKNRPEAFLKYAFNLGLNKPLSFDIKSTRNPLLKNTKDRTWSTTTSLPFMSIGYEMELSALQILSVYNAVANNGSMVKPFMVREVKEFGKVIQKNEPLILNEKVCSDETIKLLKKLLEGVVENGTGNKLKGLAYKVAGKTGTAQKATSNGYDKSAHKASFVGYFPADNPKYSCIVMINDPSLEDYYGGSIAGPVFREIADKVFSTNISLHKPIKRVETPSMPKVKNGNRSDIKFVLNHIGISSHLIIGNAESEYVRSSASTQSLNLKEITTDVNLIPDVVGMGLKDAVYLLENRGVKVIVEGYGTIRFQSISAGTRTRKGNIIYLRLNP
jgi:cell division protein FtsI (penicillin-binding protein 3)